MSGAEEMQISVYFDQYSHEYPVADAVDIYKPIFFIIAAMSVQ